MATGERPGGLTALAVFNFIFSGFGALGILGLSAGTALIEQNGDAAAKEAVSQVKDHLALLIALMAIPTVLLLVSGIGFLKQKRVMGRYVGNGYAIFSLASTAISLALMEQKFEIGTIIGLIYPVLVLILINTTFRDDLAN
jgi:hypothetical protein